MSEDSTTLLALKNAWTGAVAASDRVRDLAASVEALPAETPLDALDLTAYHAAAFAQSNAVMALRGLVEQLQRKQVRDAEAG
jgi:hypothetical protein